MTFICCFIVQNIWISIILTDSYKSWYELGGHILVTLIHRLKKEALRGQVTFLRQVSKQIRSEEKSSKNFKQLFKGMQVTKLELKSETWYVDIASETEVDFFKLAYKT